MSLEVINGLKPAKFKYLPRYGNAEQYTLGVMAQDVAKFYPISEFTVVREREDVLSVDYLQLIAPMIKAIQELSDKVDRLKEQINDHT